MALAAFVATALRCGIFLLAGIAGLGWLSGYTANPARRGPVSLWLAVPALGAVILITAASTVVGTTLRDAATAYGRVLSTLIGTSAFVLTLWVSAIAVQVAQNFFYRRVGARPQPIRWFAGQQPRRRKTKVTKRQRG